jgi:hypothetical protein
MNFDYSSTQDIILPRSVIKEFASMNLIQLSNKRDQYLCRLDDPKVRLMKGYFKNVDINIVFKGVFVVEEIVVPFSEEFVMEIKYFFKSLDLVNKLFQEKIQCV